MANEQNLRPRTSLSKEEAKEMGAKGGKRSAEVRQARKTFNKSLIEALEKNGTQDSIVKAIIKKAKLGNIKAFEVIRDTVGEKPKEKVEINQDINKIACDIEKYINEK